MARRHRRYGRRRGGGKSFFGLSTKGPVLPAMGILGIAAAYLFSDTVGNMIPVVNQQSAMIKNAAGGFVIGGPAGALVGVAKSYLGGSGAGSSSGGW